VPAERQWVSQLECVSAIGKKIHYVIVFKGKTVQLQWFPAENIPDMLYTVSENGWTSNAIGLYWLREVFIPETAPLAGEHRILVCDGHGSHVSIDFMWECYVNNIHLHFLPPHSLHATQPLDLTCFSPLKSRYRTKIAELATLDNGAKVKKDRFLKCYIEAREECFIDRNIRSGWKAAGLVPFNPEIVINYSYHKPAKQTTISPTIYGNKR
jgi:DDE superfamily endonuclease